MTDCDALLAGIVADPLEETRWLILADWLEEHDDPRRAELLRLHRKMLATCCEPDAHPDRAAWQARMVELLIAGVRPCVPQETLMLPGGVPMTFSFIPPGEFLMGSPDEFDGNPVHQATVPRGFYIGVTPVTQAQWKAVMATAPSHFKGPKRPVEQVSWDDCQQFCAKFAESTGREANLPTDAEWEYACRAGTTTEYHFGDVINTDLANYYGKKSWNGSPIGEDREQTTDVGSFPANGWGMFDVHGNVNEWCADGSPTHTTNEDISSPELLMYPFPRVRGGSWGNIPYYLRSGFRNVNGRADRHVTTGFRVCLRPD